MDQFGSVGSILNNNDALLEVGTRAGGGTRFTVWWPISPKGPQTKRRPSRIEKPRVNLPILVLDDVPDVATAIATVLSDGGYEVAETNAPEIAIETIEEDPDGWACLITDYDMPEMNGGDLIARLEQTVPDLPVIVVSALARRLTDRRLSNAVAVLQKPVNKDKLLAAVLEATT